MTKPLAPGSRIGILGGGQLGRMLAVAASRLGFGCHIYDPDPMAPAAQVAANHTCAPYEDIAALRAFAQGVDVITFEFENIPTAALDLLEASGTAIFPDRRALATSQDRLTEKAFLRDIGLATAPYSAVDTAAELRDAMAHIGAQGILKTRRFGYDGKGQQRLSAPTEIDEAIAGLAGAPAIFEGLVNFSTEISVVVARAQDGQVSAFDPGENVHEGGIRSPLWVRWPDRLSPRTSVDVPLAHIDLMPTLLDAVNADVPDGVTLDGRSALGLLQGSDDGWTDRSIFVQSHRGDVPARGHHCAVIGPRWKLVRATGFGRESAPEDAPWRLYDLLEDPAETTDRATSSVLVRIELHAAYQAWFTDVSTSRPNGFAPPRIEPCTPQEPVTTLTRQDWRCDGKEGWGAKGRWLLRVEEPIEVDVTLVFVRERTLDSARFDIAGDVIERDADGTSRRRHALGRVALPRGDVDLSAVCFSESETFDAYQVVLERAAD